MIAQMDLVHWSTWCVFIKKIFSENYHDRIMMENKYVYKS